MDYKENPSPSEPEHITGKDENEHKPNAMSEFYVSVNTDIPVEEQTKLDATGALFSFKPYKIKSMDQLKDFVCKHIWAHEVFKYNYRNSANFIKTDLIPLDIDNDGEQKCLLDEAKVKFAGYKHIIATSRTHQKIKHPGTSNEKPAVDRFRVILFLEKTITDAEIYKQTWLALEKQFPFVDPQTKDTARYWYPCKEIISIKESGKLVSVVYSKPAINTKSQTSKTKTSIILPELKGGDYSNFSTGETVNDKIGKFVDVLDVAKKYLKIGKDEKISNINIKFFFHIFCI